MALSDILRALSYVHQAHDTNFDSHHNLYGNIIKKKKWVSNFYGSSLQTGTGEINRVIRTLLHFHDAEASSDYHQAHKIKYGTITPTTYPKKALSKVGVSPSRSSLLQLFKAYKRD